MIFLIPLLIISLFSAGSFFYYNLSEDQPVKQYLSNYSTIDNLFNKKEVIPNYIVENAEKNFLRNSFIETFEFIEDKRFTENPSSVPANGNLNKLDYLLPKLEKLDKMSNNQNLFTLQMIIVEDQTAVIDNQQVKKGDLIHDYIVKSITADTVCISKKKDVKCLKMFH